MDVFDVRFSFSPPEDIIVQTMFSVVFNFELLKCGNCFLQISITRPVLQLSNISIYTLLLRSRNGLNCSFAKVSLIFAFRVLMRFYIFFQFRMFEWNKEIIRVDVVRTQVPIFQALLRRDCSNFICKEYCDDVAVVRIDAYAWHKSYIRGSLKLGIQGAQPTPRMVSC